MQGIFIIKILSLEKQLPSLFFMRERIWKEKDQFRILTQTNLWSLSQNNSL